MAFGTSFQTRAGTADGEKLENPFLSLKDGMEVSIRILDNDIVSFWSYWIEVNVNGTRAGRSIAVGKDNPIRTFMDSLPTDDKRFRKPSHRWRVNVLDRTLKDDGTRLNKVMILEGGPQLLGEISPLDGRVRARSDFSKKLSLQEFDILLVVSGEGKLKKIKVMQDVSGDEGPLPNELLSLMRYDLKTMCQPIPNEAVQRLLDGADYGEVMKSIGRGSTYPMVDPNVPF